MVHAGRAVSINLARCCPDIYCSAVSYAAPVEGKGEQATLAADDSDEDGGIPPVNIESDTDED